MKIIRSTNVITQEIRWNERTANWGWFAIVTPLFPPNTLLFSKLMYTVNCWCASYMVGTPQKSKDDVCCMFLWEPWTNGETAMFSLHVFSTTRQHQITWLQDHSNNGLFMFTQALLVHRNFTVTVTCQYRAINKIEKYQWFETGGSIQQSNQQLKPIVLHVGKTIGSTIPNFSPNEGRWRAGAWSQASSSTPRCWMAFPKLPSSRLVSW